MATQNTKTKTTLADKDKKVLMILGALVILALAWFLGYQKFNEQRETVGDGSVTASCKSIQESTGRG